MSALNQFDKIAVVYDVMAALLFGRSIRSAQRAFLHHIPPSSTVLMLGGGTGWLARELLKQRPDGRITYIEASAKMIELAKEKTNYSTQIEFIHGTEEDIPAMKFDVVITNFFLDMFQPESLSSLAAKIRQALNEDGLWIATDFVDGGKWWQRTLLRLMYWFFRTTCHIESSALPDWQKIISDQAMTCVEQQSFYAGFIETLKFSV